MHGGLLTSRFMHGDYNYDLAVASVTVSALKGAADNCEATIHLNGSCVGSVEGAYTPRITARA